MKASEQAVIQNLKDAGCCRETVERFLALGDAGDVQGQLSHRPTVSPAIMAEGSRSCSWIWAAPTW